jgi:predicted dehydrogenase
MVVAGRRLRVGVVGAGWVSRHHLRGWRKHIDVAEVVALADPNPSTLKQRAEEFAIGATYATAEELLAAAVPDILDICAPREAHTHLVRLAAKHGLPTICQKPLAPSLAEARKLVADIGDRALLMVHENWRFRAYYRRIGEWLREGVVGDIHQVQLEFVSSGMIPDADGRRPALIRQPFLRSLDRLLVMEILIHHLDTLRVLIGEMDVRWSCLERSNDDIVGEDIATVLLARRHDGIPVSIVANLAVHGAPPLPRDRLRIFGSDGTIELDGARLTSVGQHLADETFDPDETYQGAYDRTIGHFLEQLAGESRFETGPGDNMKTLALVEAIYTANSSVQATLSAQPARGQG